MYLLTIKDGLGTRHIGPYASPKHASTILIGCWNPAPSGHGGRSMRLKPLAAPWNCRLLLPDQP